MSPPVLGTLLGLSIGLIFTQVGPDSPTTHSPSWDVLSSPSLPDPVSSPEVPLTDADDQKFWNPEKPWVRLTKAEASMTCDIDDAHWGLFGAYYREPAFFVGLQPRQSCDLCLDELMPGSVVYTWKAFDLSCVPRVRTLHHHCLVDQSQIDKMESHTLRRLSALLSKTNHQQLIDSLVELESELAEFDPDVILDAKDDAPEWSNGTWILFRGAKEPCCLQNLSSKEEFMLENGRPYTYVEPPRAAGHQGECSQSKKPRHV